VVNPSIRSTTRKCSKSFLFPTKTIGHDERGRGDVFAEDVLPLVFRGGVLPLLEEQDEVLLVVEEYPLSEKLLLLLLLLLLLWLE